MPAKLYALVGMLRPKALLIVVIFGLIGVAAGGHRLESVLGRLSLVVAILACWYINGTCINDLSDESIDKVNLKGAGNRPLANRKVSRSFIAGLAVAAGAACLGLAFFGGYAALIITACAIMLNWIYSMPPIRISGRGVLAPIMLPLGYVALPYLLAGVFAEGGFTYEYWLLLALLYISFSGRIILKDFRDVKGDRAYGKRTFIVRYGARATVMYSIIAFGIGSIGLAVVFADKNPLLSTILICHYLVVAWCLGRLQVAKSIAGQVLIISNLAMLATTTLVCILLQLNGLPEGLDQTVYNAFMILIALAGVGQAVYATLHMDKYKAAY